MATIMIVDDEPATCRTLASRLAAAGHTAFAIRSGRQALRLLRTVAVDLVLLDAALPDLGGPEVLRRLRGRPPGRRQRVIVYSLGGGAGGPEAETVTGPAHDDGDAGARALTTTASLLAEVEAALGRDAPPA